jgi:hypothetical protein
MSVNDTSRTIIDYSRVMLQIVASLTVTHLATFVSCGNVANNKEHKLMLHPPFFHSDHLVIKVQNTI